MKDLLSTIPELLGAPSSVRFDEPMSKHTTLRVGGPADCYVEPASEEALSKLLQFCHAKHIPIFVVGRGSNLLVRDGGIRGVVIALSQPTFSKIDVSGSELKCGGGAKLKQVAVEARRQSLAGLEFLEGIPGTIGGALRMNAGAMARSMFDAVKSIRHMDLTGKVYESAKDDVHFEYRHCELFQTHIALSAILIGQPALRGVIETRMQEYSRKRWDSQPAAPSAGCIFKNPPTVPSGKLVQELGLKGTRVGGAVVSDVHGNFIVNEGGATASDVLRLIAIIKQRAREERAIHLETEVQIVGEPSASESDPDHDSDPRLVST